MSRAQVPRWVPFALVLALALAWRLLLMGRYYGWEESDYGNLAMVRGVLDGHFLHYDMNHMPGYYALGAALLAVVGDTVVAARGVTLLGGLVSVGLAMWLAERLAGRTAALLAGLLLVVQPELALYSTSSLREPVYAAFVLGMLAALSRERLVLAGTLAGAAFLVRFDAALVLGPILALHALGRAPRPRRLVGALVPLCLTILAWSAYCAVDHGTPWFWQHAVDVNVETGLGAEATGRGEWVLDGLRVAGTLGAWLLPWRIGWGTWLGLLLGLALAPWRSHGLGRTWAALALAMTGFWLGIGFSAQHSPDHNLYWKWLCPVVPVIVPLGVAGLLRVGSRLRPGLAAALVGLALVQAGASNLKETRRQLQRSEAWYGPQLRLAQWIEATVPEDVPMLLDNIPACWIGRRDNERPLTSWFDVPAPPDDPDAFAAWVAQAHLRYVMWFREDWTQAPVVAPFLAAGGTWSRGSVRLVETGREDGYGWIFFEVQERGQDAVPVLDAPPGDG